MAEWLCRGLQILVNRFDSGLGLLVYLENFMSIFTRDFSISCESFDFEKKSNLPNIALIHVHRDEIDAKECGLKCSNQFELNFIYFSYHEMYNQNVKTREINFFNKNTKEIYSIDPNRIWTEDGIKQQTKNLNLYKSDSIHALNKEILAITDYIKKFLLQFNIIIALHNNTGKDFSINYYIEYYIEDQKNIKLKEGASEIFIFDKNNLSDFFITTSIVIFNKIRKINKFNCVLLDISKKIDDGSFSTYALDIKKDYVNIETLLGRKDLQLTMLRSLIDIL